MRKLRLDAVGRLESVPGALFSFRPSPHFDLRPEGEAGRVSLIVVHYISLPAGHFGGDAVDRLFMGTLDPDRADWPEDPAWEPLKELKGLRVSTHFFVRRTGEIIQYVETEKRAWHAGLSSFRGRSRCNDFSVGIELEGTGSVPFEDTQYEALQGLVEALQTRYPIRYATGHECIAPGRKADPGPFFDWERFRRLCPSDIEVSRTAAACGNQL